MEVMGIERVIRIENKNIYERYKRYKKRLMGRVGTKGKAGRGNAEYLWHGTDSACEIYPQLPNSYKLCQDIYCSLCSIIKYGFLGRFIGRKGGGYLLRYGKGHYFSSNIHKAFAYSTQRHLLLSKVLLGNSLYPKDRDNYINKIEIRKGNSKFGFDSVIGSRNIDSDLQHEEQCVYNDNAILPLYLVIFKLDNQ